MSSFDLTSIKYCVFHRFGQAKFDYGKLEPIFDTAPAP